MTPKPAKAMPLYCDRDHGGCGKTMAVLPDVVLMGTLRSGELANGQNGALWCQGCGLKWEVALTAVRRKAA